MSPSRLSLFSSPAGEVAVGGKSSSSPSCRPYELRDCESRQAEEESCDGGGGSSGDVGVDGMAAPRGDLKSGRVWRVDDFESYENLFGFILKLEAKLERIDAESGSNGDLAK